MRDFDAERKRLEQQLAQLKQDERDARKISSENILNKLQSGKYEVYFQDNFNDGWFNVVGFGAIGGLSGNNIFSSIDILDELENIGKNSGPKFVQIGPVEIGIYRETRVQYDAVQGYNNPNAGRGSELVATKKGNIALSISPELKIQLKGQSESLFDLDDDLGF
jgi:hypothetical protein